MPTCVPPVVHARRRLSLRAAEEERDASGRRRSRADDRRAGDDRLIGDRGARDARPSRRPRSAPPSASVTVLLVHVLKPPRGEVLQRRASSPATNASPPGTRAKHGTVLLVKASTFVRSTPTSRNSFVAERVPACCPKQASNAVALTSPQTSSFAADALQKSPEVDEREAAGLPLVDLDERVSSAAREVAQDQDVSVGVLAGERCRAESRRRRP